VHNHGNTVAVIKLLSGVLKSEWYNPLSDNYNEIPQVIKSSYIYSGNITWMTPCYYQTHKLINEGSTEAAISIQAYSHVESKDPNEQYTESFNYIVPGNSDLRRFYPNADFDYDKLEEIVKSEINTKTCFNPGYRKLGNFLCNIKLWISYATKNLFIISTFPTEKLPRKKLLPNSN